MTRRIAGLFCLCSLVVAVHAGGPPKNADLTSPVIPFSAKELDLKTALDEIHAKTGNRIADRRSAPKALKLKMPAEAKPFWPTLDALCEQAGIGYSAYQPDGGIALVDRPNRKLRVDYSGLFRFALKRISVTRDDETSTHYADITLETAWEPRLKPLYLNVEGGSATVGKKTEKLDRQAVRGVAGTGAAELELRLHAPNRAVGQIDSLKGSLKVIAIPKMLEFSFAKPAGKQTMEKESVVVRIVDVVQRPTRWTIEVETEYPEGAIVPLESFQTWLGNNRVWLAWTSSNKTTHILEPVGETPVAGGKGLRFRYDFLPRGDVPLPAVGANTTLKLTTPSRVVAISVPFTFQDLPLP